MRYREFFKKIIASHACRPFLLRISFFVSSLFILIAGASAASRYWVAALPSNWNNILNWSAASGGLPGASVPGIADDVNFDGNGLKNCTMDATVSVKSITVAAGHTGTIIQGASTITTMNAASFSGGVFTGGSANITIGGNFTLNGTSFTSSSAILEFDNAIAAFTTATFTHNNGTVRLNTAAGLAMTGISPVFTHWNLPGWEIPII